MFVEVAPEELPGIGAQLNTIHGSLSTVIDTALVSSIPALAASVMLIGGDSVTRHAAMCLATQTVSDCTAIVPGLAHLLAGAEMIYPVSADYALSDEAGAATVSMAGAWLNR